MKKIIAVDFYDLIWKQEEIFTISDIEKLFCKYAQHGVTAVLWRLSLIGKLLYYSNTVDRFSISTSNNPIAIKALKVMDSYDPAKVALEMGKKYGIEVYFWLTLFDEAAYSNSDEFVSSLCKEHPEYSWLSKDGKESFYGVLSYAYSEVQEFKLNQIKEIVSYGADGLYLCNRSHSRSPLIRKKMETASDVSLWCRENSSLIISEQNNSRGKYGFNPVAVENFHGNLDDEKAWQSYHGKFFTSFLEKVRQINSGKNYFGLRYAPNFGPYVYGNYYFDWEKLSDGSLVDGLAYDLQPPNFDKEEDFKEFYSKTKGEKFLWMSLSANNPTNLLAAYNDSLARWKKHMDGIIFFEAYCLTNNQPYWDFLKNF